jgi:hypothetical protein
MLESEDDEVISPDDSDERGDIPNMSTYGPLPRYTNKTLFCVCQSGYKPGTQMFQCDGK